MGAEHRSARILGGFFGALIAGVVAWVLILLGISGQPLSILLTPAQIPTPYVTAYMVGLYFWLVALVALIWRRRVRLSWSEMGLRPSGLQFLRGLLIGAGGLAVVMGIEMGLGWAQFAPPAHWPLGLMGGILAASLAFALSEEILFRGFFLRTLALDHPAWRAVLISALLYAALHFLRTSLTWNDLVMFAVLVAAGLVLALGTLRTGSISLAVGIHASWVAFFSLSQQLHLWRWTETGLPIQGGGTIALLGLFVFVPMAFVVNRSHA
jgi:membrane protease YdiL (CAAX protease family)